MGELYNYFKEKYSKKNNNEIKDMMNKQRVKNEIIKQCSEYLKEVGDEFTFEVIPSELQYVVEVITEEPLKSQFNITQISNSLFIASLKELEL